jgi:hypothetical protein
MYTVCPLKRRISAPAVRMMEPLMSVSSANTINMGFVATGVDINGPPLNGRYTAVNDAAETIISLYQHQLAKSIVDRRTAMSTPMIDA